MRNPFRSNLTKLRNNYIFTSLPTLSKTISKTPKIAILGKYFCYLTVACLAVTTSIVKPVFAEGSRTLYPNSFTGSRANIQWKQNNTTYLFSDNGDNTKIRQGTILNVYAKVGEKILLGSSSFKQIGSYVSDIRVFTPGIITGSIGAENLTTPPPFTCGTSNNTTGNQGKILNRTQELAGPRAISGGGNPNGYEPCVYTVTQEGIHSIVFQPTGPTGGGVFLPPTDNSPSLVFNHVKSLLMPKSSDSDRWKFPKNSHQDRYNLKGKIAQTFVDDGDNISAWDVTVRSSDPTSTVDLDGRVFVYYLSLSNGNNTNIPVNFTVYPVSTDGFKYSVNLNGISSNEFLLYANSQGNLDPNGTPIYHNIVSNNIGLNNRSGGVNPAKPEFPIFLSNTINNVTEVNQTLAAINPNIPTTPTLPNVSLVSFESIAGGGGTFKYNANINHSYQIVISRDGTNFDPDNSSNRVLRETNIPAGHKEVTWNGIDNTWNPINNTGTHFPVGTNYKAKISIKGGEFHFPLANVSNSPNGSPIITLLNVSCPPLTGGCNGAFYDDRGYTTSGHETVGTIGTVLSNIQKAPIIASKDPFYLPMLNLKDNSKGNSIMALLNTSNSCPSLIGNCQKDFYDNIPTDKEQKEKESNIFYAQTAPTIANSNPITGFNTNSGQRAYSGNWGNQKALDLWTYYPSIQDIQINVVGTQPDLTITTSHTGDFIIGQNGTYTLTVSNSPTGAPINNLSTNPITVTDTLPPGLTFVSGSNPNWNCSATGQLVTCTYIGTTPVASGATLPAITLNVNVPNTTSPGVVTNTSTVTTPNDSNTANNTSPPDSTNIFAPPAVQIVTNVIDNNGNNTVNIGDNIQYQITVTNNVNNPIPLTNIVLQDIIPVQLQALIDPQHPVTIVTTNNGSNPNFSLSSTFPNNSFTGTGNPVTLTNPGTLAPGGAVTITFTTQIVANPSPVSNQVNITYAQNPNPVTAITTTAFIGTINPAGTKSVRLVIDADNSNSITKDDTVEYTITYINNDPNSLVANFLITDPIDATNLTFVPGSYSFQAFNGNAAANNITTVTANPNYNGSTDTNLTNAIIKGNLGANGGKVVIKFRAVVKNSGPRTIYNQAIGTSSLPQTSTLPLTIPPLDVPQPAGNDTRTQFPVAQLLPNLRLVKRITSITRNGVPLSGVDFNSIVVVNSGDNAAGWPTSLLRGVVNIPSTIAAESGDDVEYTVYYLSDGNTGLTGSKFCDLIPKGTIFNPDSFGAGIGILLNVAGVTNLLNNNGNFLSPLTPLPAGNSCVSQTNSDGAITFPLGIFNNGSISHINGNNYGFVRFRVKVQ